MLSGILRFRSAPARRLTRPEMSPRLISRQAVGTPTGTEIADRGRLIAAPVDRFIAAAEVQLLGFQRLSQQAQCLPAQAVAGVADASQQPAAAVAQLEDPPGRHRQGSRWASQHNRPVAGPLFMGIQHEQPGGMARAAGRRLLALGCLML